MPRYTPLWTFLLCLGFVTVQTIAFAISLPPSRSACAVSVAGTTLQGTATISGACRYVVKYGQTPSRWAKSTMASSLISLPNLPPSCPQDSWTNVVGSSQSEDCLFATIYVPQTRAPLIGWPVLSWIHGGSFDQGSASAPGLDGSNLAVNGQLIVVVLQYRLGVLGFLPPTSAPTSSDPNLGLQDVILGLQAIQSGISYLGGDRSRVTVGGQSSGASMIRAMWGAPSAKGLFRAAIMQSDPMSYGFSTSAITGQLQTALYSSSQLSNCSTLACLQSVPVSEILSAQDGLVANAPFQLIGVPLAEPIRPTFGTVTLPLDPTSQLWNSPSSLSIHPSSLPLLITTVKNEAGPAVQSLFPSPTPLSNATYMSYLSLLFGQERANTIYSSGYYSLPSDVSSSSIPSTSQLGSDGDNFREVFEKLSTDAAWRCGNRDAARHWAAAGGKVWVGEWRQGLTYPDNDIQNGYCSVPGRVCHEDDIFSTFDNAPNPSSSVTSFESSILSYWSSFITNLDPNPVGSRRCSQGSSQTTWKPYTSTSSQAGVLPLGGDGTVTSCPPIPFWGGSVPYDWQLYG